jgi:hypothetical protein
MLLVKCHKQEPTPAGDAMKRQQSGADNGGHAAHVDHKGNSKSLHRSASLASRMSQKAHQVALMASIKSLITCELRGSFMTIQTSRRIPLYPVIYRYILA